VENAATVPNRQASVKQQALPAAAIPGEPVFSGAPEVPKAPDEARVPRPELA